MHIDRIREKLEIIKDFSGVVQISNADGIQLIHTSGYANRAEAIKINKDTRFGIASGTKAFTALAVMKLVEEGSLHLDENPLTLLGLDFPNIPETVTLRHLLSHTSGIYDYYNEDNDADFETIFRDYPLYRINGPRDMMPLLIEGSSYFQPGEGFKYCNSAYVILGIILEAASGRSYEEALKDSILMPYGLSSSGCFSLDALPTNTAFGYVEDQPESLKTNIYSIPKVCTADGGLFTTVADIENLWKNLMSDKMFSPATTSEILKTQASIDDREDYGLGIYIKKHPQKPSYYIIGEDPGVSFFSEYWPNQQEILTVISNTTEGAWQALRQISGDF